MKNPLLLITFLCASAFLQAQGCSDAGICSIADTHDAAEKTAKNQIEMGGVFAAGESDTRYIAPYVSYVRTFNTRWSGSVRITSSFAEGSLGNRGSIGDAFLLLNYKPITEQAFRWTYTAGTKIPFNHANLTTNNQPLPLDYQSSLGTFDFLAAANVSYKAWDFNAALQLPVFNINENAYFSELSGTDDFPTTNQFERRPDALLRATYTLKPKGKFTFKPNLLFIYHLGEDTYEDFNGNRKAIDGSDGLTINGNLITAYDAGIGSIELSLATPFAVRDVRPDGLTREWTVGISYRTRF